MSFLINWHDGTREGRCISMPDEYHGLVTEVDADRIAQQLRTEQGKEPHHQSIRGRLIRLAKQRRVSK